MLRGRWGPLGISLESFRHVQLEGRPGQTQDVPEGSSFTVTNRSSIQSVHGSYLLCNVSSTRVYLVIEHDKKNGDNISEVRPM